MTIGVGRRACRLRHEARTTREDLDDEHAATAARTGARVDLLGIAGGDCLRLGLGGRGAARRAARAPWRRCRRAGRWRAGRSGGCGGSPWAARGEEAADELARRQRHDLEAPGAVDAIVLVFERDGARVGGDEAAVRDGDAVRVARQIGEHGFGPAERLLGVDDPFAIASAARGRRRRLAASASPACAPKNASLPAAWAASSISTTRRRNRRESTRTGRKKLRPAGDPAVAILRQAAARHDHVHVRMMRHRRAPGVQHRGDADPGAEPLLVGRDRQRRLGAMALNRMS